MNEVKELQKENEDIRKGIDEIIRKELSTIEDDYSDLWKKINLLIDNEIEQEKFCNE